MRQERAARAKRAIDSRRNCKQHRQLRNRFAVLEALSKDAERERLSICDRLIPRGSARQDTGKFRDFGNPTTVFFLFNFNGQLHDP